MAKFLRKILKSDKIFSSIYIPMATVSSTIIDSTWGSSFFTPTRIPAYLITHSFFWIVYFILWKRFKKWLLYTFIFSTCSWILFETHFWLSEVPRGLQRTSPAPTDSLLHAFFSIRPPGIIRLSISWGVIYLYPWIITLLIMKITKRIRGQAYCPEDKGKIK